MNSAPLAKPPATRLWKGWVTSLTGYDWLLRHSEFPSTPRRYSEGVDKAGSHRLSPNEERQVREAEGRLEVLRRTAEEAHAEGRLGEVIRDTPAVHEQLQSFLDA